MYYYVFPTFLILVILRKWRTMKWGFCKNNVNLTNKVVIITGANSGIGFETAKELAKREAKVILACRDLNKANDAISKILLEIPQAITSKTTLIPMQLDLASLNSVKTFVKEFNETGYNLDILINNAGVSYPKDVVKTTEDGFEIQFGVNHVGHFLLTNLLLPKLKNASPSRVIIVSSTLHQRGHIYLDDLNLNDRNNKSGQYENSKLANAYFGRELAKRIKNQGVNVYCVCPGWVYTNLFQHYHFKWYHYILVASVAYWFMRTPRQGAQTIIHCATEPALNNETGFFYRDCKRYKSTVEFDTDTAEKLWDASEKMVSAFM